MNNKMHSNVKLQKMLPVLMLVLTLSTATVPAKAFGEAGPGANSENLKGDDFDKKLSEGRDLIDREAWAQATQKFTEIINKYPNNKSVDAALYWLAFCYKKQGQFKQADEVIARLIKEFPESSWANDARVMKLEIAPATTAIYGAGAATPYPAKSGETYLQLSQTFEGFAAVGSLGALGSQVPLEREDEIKLAAFQSLLAADPQRGVEAMTQVFQNGKTSENLKIDILRTVRRPSFMSRELAPVASLSGAGTFAAPLGNTNLKPLGPLLREPLLKIFKNESNIKIRKEIIYLLAGTGEAENLDYLAQMYASENDRELKKAILNSLSQSAGGFAVALKNLDTGSKPAFAKLMEIVRTEKDPELKTLALNNLRRFHGWSADGQLVQFLSDAYDSETDEKFKISVIQSLAEMNQNQAAGKLLEIAKTEKSDKLKLEAIRQLGKSKNPEALKYLEELMR